MKNSLNMPVPLWFVYALIGMMLVFFAQVDGFKTGPFLASAFGIGFVVWLIWMCATAPYQENQ